MAVYILHLCIKNFPPCDLFTITDIYYEWGRTHTRRCPQNDMDIDCSKWNSVSILNGNIVYLEIKSVHIW